MTCCERSLTLACRCPDDENAYYTLRASLSLASLQLQQLTQATPDNSQPTDRPTDRPAVTAELIVYFPEDSNGTGRKHRVGRRPSESERDGGTAADLCCVVPDWMMMARRDLLLTEMKRQNNSLYMYV